MSEQFDRTHFFKNVAQLIEQARNMVVKSVNVAMCVTYYEIGRMIVEQEQGGNQRAEYGAALVEELSDYLTGKFGKGFSPTNLRNFRKFYLSYAPQIQQTASAEFTVAPDKIQQTASTEFKLSWSHYQVLMRIENVNARSFYEIEAADQQWSVEQLRRQYQSSLYERLALSAAFFCGFGVL